MPYKRVLTLVKKSFILTYKDNLDSVFTTNIYARTKIRAHIKAIDTIEEMNEGCNWTSYNYISLMEY